ncbi:MAG: hypothetical protein U0166_06205 [Acidobacteriota bacterium]
MTTEDDPLARKRSRRRKTVATSGAILFLGLLAAHLLLTRVAERRLAAIVARLDPAGTHLAPEALAPAEVPDAENRVRLVRAAADALSIQADERSLRLPLSSGADAKPDDLARFAPLIARNEMSLTLLREAQRRSGSRWEFRYQDGHGMALPSLSLIDLGNLERMTVAKAMAEADAQRPADAIADLDLAMSVPRCLAQEPDLFLQIMRDSFQRSILNGTRRVLGGSHPTAADLARLDAILEDMTRPDPWAAGLAAELRSMHRGLSLVEDERPHNLEDWPSWMRSRAIVWLCRPEILRQHGKLLVQIDAVARARTQPRARRDPIPLATSWMASFTSEPPYVCQRADLSDARRGLARTAIALSRYHLDHGAYPDSLAELVPGYLPSTPADPFADGAFSYADRRHGIPPR